MTNYSKKNKIKKIIGLSILIIVSTLSGIAQPLVADGGLSQTICNGSSATIGGSPTANYGSPGYTYSWAPATGLSSTIVSNPIASPSATTTYTITVTDAVLTVATATLTITVNPYPDADFSYSSSGCQFSPNALPSFLPGASAGTFTSIPAGMIINASTGEIDLTTSPPNSYLVTNTIAAAGGCPSVNANHGFTITPLPNITPSPASYLPICSGDAIVVAFSSSSVGAIFNWTSSEFNTSGSALSGTGNISEILSASPTTGTTTYTITPTAGGCAGTPLTYPITINPTPFPNFSLPSPACQYASNIFPSMAGSATIGTFSATPAGLVINPTTGEIDLTASTVGTYDITNTIAAAGGCPSASQTYTGFTISPFVDPTITDVLPVCYGDAPFNFVAASAGGTWFGTGITNATLGTFDPTVAGPGTFTITHQSSGPCSFAYTDTTVISVTAASMYGQVTYSGGALNSGTNTAVLYNYSSTFATFDTAKVSNVDALGYFQFDTILTGDYLIKVFADTLVYPLLVPTYYDNEFLWDTALVMTHSCLTDTANVLMVEGIVTSGPGMLSGNISEGFGFVALTADNGYARIPGEPIPGIDVKLGRNPGGQMMTNTPTDPAGNYAFTNIPISLPGQYYTVYVDIPGLGRDSVYNVTVTATDTVFTQLDYLADSNSVYPIYPVNVSVGNIAKEDVRFTVYPNPTNTNATVSYVLKTASMVKLDVYDVLGKKLESPLNTNQQAGTYKINLTQLKAGIYFVNLNINNNSNTVRLVVID